MKLQFITSVSTVQSLICNQISNLLGFIVGHFKHMGVIFYQRKGKYISFFGSSNLKPIT